MEHARKDMALDGTLDKDGKMTQGYDYKEANNFGHKLVRIFGGYDRDTRAMASFSALGKLFFMHKNFLPAIAGRMLRERTVSNIEGKRIVYTDENGQKAIKWVGQPSEGIFISLLAAGRYLNKFRGEQVAELQPDQIRNLKVLMADMFIMSMAFGAASMIASAFDDDDEWGKLAHGIALGGFRDMSASYNLMDLEGVLKPVALDMTFKTLDKVFKALTGDATLEDFYRLPGFTKQLDNTIKLLEE